MVKGIQIAIDGPAGAGKSTVAKLTAERLGYTYIDTGAMYRSLTHKALQSGIRLDQEEQLTDLLRSTEIDLLPAAGGQSVLLDGQDATEVIRSSEVTANVSIVAAHPAVRELMVEKQRRLASDKGVVMDGRDIGTDVLPNAQLKVFLTATVEERASRRYKENEKRGIPTSYDQLKAEISARDHADSVRQASPLRQAEDAVLLDTTSMTIQEVAAAICQMAEKRKMI